MKTLKNKKRPYLLCKRILDVVFSFFLLLFLAFPMLIISVAITVTSRGGAIFKQRRIGKGGKIFVCYKFRTMYLYAPSNRPTSMFDDAEKYITVVGRFLRRTSLDELPQLFNVLKGDMSLIGPRPLICEETEMHKLRIQSGAYEIRPGLTGLAQINGRDMLCDIDKAELDARYASGICFASDIGIFFKTIIRIVRKEGIRQ